METIYPRKLNLGCGYDVRSGYLNVDFVARHQPDLVADVRDLSVLPCDWFEEVIANDVLEHLPRADTSRALAEWARVMKHGGSITIRVPSLLHLIEMLLCGDYQSPAFHEGVIQCAYGTQAYDGDYHLTTFTPLVLQQHLLAAGLTPRAAHLVDGWMLEVVAGKGTPQTIDLKAAFGSRRAFVWRLMSRLTRAQLGRYLPIGSSHC
jgi:hypothetical protein